MAHQSGSGHEKTQFFVPYNGKIADITHADTNKHFLDLAVALSETRKIIAITVKTNRVAGTGYVYMYPNEGINSSAMGPGGGASPFTVIANATNRLQYALSVANDDWDVYCFGYVVEA